jgi:hypothetical protein
VSPVQSGSPGKATEPAASAAKQTSSGGRPSFPPDFDEEIKETIRLVRPYTMTSPDKLHALISSVRYLESAKIPGAFVECGVWRGGSMHAVARSLDHLGVYDRELFLFDTFAGMTEPTDRDVTIGRTRSAAELLSTQRKTANVWAIASLKDVRTGLETLPYPIKRFHLIQGRVEETIPDQAPEQIALLRLDTDWYESTRHELAHLYPRLASGGVLIIDDYGTWQGAKEATDEFVASLAQPLLLLRAGRGRVAVKP